MITEQLITEERQVVDFHRVILTGHGEVIIEQGDAERLMIESDAETLSKILSEVVMGRLELGQGRTLMDKISFALETSFTREPIRYYLMVRKLTDLELQGAFEVKAQGISADELRIKAGGPNHIVFENLEVEDLIVDLPVGGVVDLDGYVSKQKVVIKGPANYRAPTLKSQYANIKITGPSTAVVNVTDELDVFIRGLGSVKYYGSPKLRKKIAGLGSLSKLDTA